MELSNSVQSHGKEHRKSKLLFRVYGFRLDRSFHFTRKPMQIFKLKHVCSRTVPQSLGFLILLLIFMSLIRMTKLKSQHHTNLHRISWQHDTTKLVVRKPRTRVGIKQSTSAQTIQHDIGTAT